jgi:REP element-mobilizing transposase RayT
MPYVRRDTSAGLFHVFTHCVWAVPHLYRDDVDRLEFLRNLARVTTKTSWTCLAYCLMTSHYHLIVSVADGVLPPAMQSLNHPYALHHNRRHGLRGHVQFKRYGSRRIVDDRDLLDTFAYVANNPVEAGLCPTPGDWPWSSYGGTVGLAELASFVDPALVLRCFDWPGSEPTAALRVYVEKKS